MFLPWTAISVLPCARSHLAWGDRGGFRRLSRQVAGLSRGKMPGTRCARPVCRRGACATGQPLGSCACPWRAGPRAYVCGDRRLDEGRVGKPARHWSWPRRPACVLASWRRSCYGTL